MYLRRATHRPHQDSTVYRARYGWNSGGLYGREWGIKQSYLPQTCPCKRLWTAGNRKFPHLRPTDQLGSSFEYALMIATFSPRGSRFNRKVDCWPQNQRR